MTASVWWYDYGTHEIVRARDGMRWDPRDVPELERALHDRDNPVVDVDEVDRWVLAQKQSPAAGETATGHGTDAVESPAPVPNVRPARERVNA